MNQRPEKLLQLYLAEAGFPSEDLPRLLAYCPSLIHKFSMEEIAAIGLVNLRQFTPEKRTVYLRPFVYDIIKAEAGHANVSNFIEESVSVLAADTIEHTLTTKLLQMREKLRNG